MELKFLTPQLTHLQFHEKPSRYYHPHLHLHLNHPATLNPTMHFSRSTPPTSINKPILPRHGFSEGHSISCPSRSKSVHKRKRRNGNDEFNTTSDVLRLMDSLGVIVTPDVYASLIDECTVKGNAEGAAELLKHIQGNGRVSKFLSRPKGLALVHRMLILCMSCSLVDYAYQLFDEMPTKDSVCWCVMIAGLAHNSLYHEAMALFSEMNLEPLCFENVAAMEIMIDSVLKACMHTMNIRVARMLHAWSIKLGYTRNFLVGTAFADFYGKFWCARDANIVFYNQTQTSASIGDGDTVLCTDSVAINFQEERFSDVVAMFKEMGRIGIRKTEFTFSNVLKACAKVDNGGVCGQQIHANAIKLGMVKSYIFVQCSLVDMYSKCAMVEDARKVFDMISCELRNCNAPCWNAMINGYLKNGMSIEAIKVLYQMKNMGLQPQPCLINRVMIACGSGNLL